MSNRGCATRGKISEAGGKEISDDDVIKLVGGVRVVWAFDLVPGMTVELEEVLGETVGVKEVGVVGGVVSGKTLELDLVSKPDGRLLGREAVLEFDRRSTVGERSAVSVALGVKVAEDLGGVLRIKVVPTLAVELAGSCPLELDVELTPAVIAALTMVLEMRMRTSDELESDGVASVALGLDIGRRLSMAPGEGDARLSGAPGVTRLLLGRLDRI
jgi:hypothetical protein